MRRHPSILQEQRNQTVQAGSRTTTDGMERTTRRSTAADDVRSPSRMSLLYQRRSHRPNSYMCLPRMHAFRRRHVTFSPDVTMYFQTRWSDQDYRNARIGRWIFLAADRHRFQRRIHEFHNNFGYIFSDEHPSNLRSLIEFQSLNDLISSVESLSLNQ